MIKKTLKIYIKRYSLLLKCYMILPHLKQCISDEINQSQTIMQVVMEFSIVYTQPNIVYCKCYQRNKTFPK